MKIETAILWGGCALLLSACAPRASEVAPIFAAQTRDFGHDCEALAAARARVTSRLVFASLRQNDMSDADRARTLGFPTPLGTLFEENREFELGRLKGDLVEINQQILGNKCEAS